MSQDMGNGVVESLAMSKARLVIIAVVVEKRSQDEAARAYGVWKGWVSKLVARYRAEDEAAFTHQNAPSEISLCHWSGGTRATDIGVASEGPALGPWRDGRATWLVGTSSRETPFARFVHLGRARRLRT